MNKDGNYLLHCVEHSEKLLRSLNYMFTGLLFNYVPSKKLQSDYAKVVGSVKGLCDGLSKLIADLALMSAKENL